MLLGNLNKHLVYRPLPIAQAELSTETTNRYVPFVYVSTLYTFKIYIFWCV